MSGTSDRAARTSRERRRRPPSVYVGGRRAVLESIRSGAAREIAVSARAPSAGLSEVLEAAEAAGVRVRTVDPRELDGLAPDHHGCVVRVALPRELSERELASSDLGDDPVVVVLDGVTDPQNLGAAARSAEAAGAAMLVTRERRSAGVTSAAVRASAGALLHLPHARVANITRALERLKARGFTVVGLDASAERTIHQEPCPAGPVALVVGAEGRGISRLVRETCDHLVALPMLGRVESLNASAALAAGLFAYVLPTRGDRRR